MYNVDALQRFVKFEAATAATDTYSIDVAATLDEASTTPSMVERLAEMALLARRLGHGWRTRSADTRTVDTPPDETLASDFDVLDELRTPKGQLESQIAALRMGGGLPYSQRLADRLDFLLSAVEEEGDSWEQDSPDSLRQMLLFLRTSADLRRPAVTITPSATFRAEWQAGRNRHLAMDFLSDGQVRFVLFSPDPRHVDRVQRVSGIVGRLDAMRLIEPYNVRRWATDAGT